MERPVECVNSSPVDLPLWLEGVGDVAEAHRARYPNVKNVLGEVYEVVLTPGDTLYVPPFWWHHVTTLGGEDDDDDDGDGDDRGTAMERVVAARV